MRHQVCWWSVVEDWEGTLPGKQLNLLVQCSLPREVHLERGAGVRLGVLVSDGGQDERPAHALLLHGQELDRSAAVAVGGAAGRRAAPGEKRR